MALAPSPLHVSERRLSQVLRFAGERHSAADLAPPGFLSLAALISLFVVRRFQQHLDIEETFPELLKLGFVRMVLNVNRR